MSSCQEILQSGDRKGTVCGKPSVAGKDVCSYHSAKTRKKEKMDTIKETLAPPKQPTTTPPTPPTPPTPLTQPTQTPPTPPKKPTPPTPPHTQNVKVYTAPPVKKTHDVSEKQIGKPTILHKAEIHDELKSGHRLPVRKTIPVKNYLEKMVVVHEVEHHVKPQPSKKEETKQLVFSILGKR